MCQFGVVKNLRHGAIVDTRYLVIFTIWPFCDKFPATQKRLAAQNRVFATGFRNRS